MMDKKRTVLVIDTETTGLYPNEGERVIEVACATVDLDLLEVTDTWQALCEEGARSQGEYHANAGTFRGVDWSTALPRAEVLRNLFSRMQGQTICGQNLPFDIGFLQSEARHHDVAWPKYNRRTLDTVSLSFPLFWLGLVDDLKLESTRKWAGLTGAQAHRAMGDVLDTAALLIRLLQTFRAGHEALDLARWREPASEFSDDFF
jgi:DNA polymerase-3 subunit epsilon